jgi:hypothetical protein
MIEITGENFPVPWLSFSDTGIQQNNPVLMRLIYDHDVFNA